MIVHKGIFDLFVKMGIRFVLIKLYVCLLNCFLVIGGVYLKLKLLCNEFVKIYWLCTKEKEKLFVSEGLQM